MEEMGVNRTKNVIRKQDSFGEEAGEDEMEEMRPDTNEVKKRTAEKQK